MELNPFTNANTRQIGRQLEQLDREIHDCLQDIRKNLRELEEVRGDTKHPGNFADAFLQALKRSDSSQAS